MADKRLLNSNVLKNYYEAVYLVFDLKYELGNTFVLFPSIYMIDIPQLQLIFINVRKKSSMGTKLRSQNWLS